MTAIAPYALLSGAIIESHAQEAIVVKAVLDSIVDCGGIEEGSFFNSSQPRKQRPRSFMGAFRAKGIDASNLDSRPFADRRTKVVFDRRVLSCGRMSTFLDKSRAEHIQHCHQGICTVSDTPHSSPIWTFSEHPSLLVVFFTKRAESAVYYYVILGKPIRLDS